MEDEKRTCPITQNECMGKSCEWWMAAVGGCAVSVTACLTIVDVCKIRFEKSPQERINELLAQLKED